jgi:hypothetical protein
VPDEAREHALNAIVAMKPERLFASQIRRFYNSLSDASVGARRPGCQAARRVTAAA